MRQLRYKITNLAPIILSAKHGDVNMVGTLQHLPGSTILGMMAARFLKQEKIAASDACSHTEFHRLFLGGALCFGNAFIAVHNADGDQYIHFPVPNSIHREKQGHRLYDLLLMDGEPTAQTKPITGFCHLDETDIRLGEVATGLNFHHERDPETGVSKDEIIFNYEAIAQGQTFQGVIKGEADALTRLVAICHDHFTAYIGRSKNAQYGKICFEFIEKTPQPVSAGIEADRNVSLTLISDAIVYNENGYSTTDPSVLEMYLGIKIKKSFVRPGDTETFVSVWRLKKPSETCVKAGSCFLFENLSAAERARLSELEKNGIGERTHEGFGQCIVGWQTEEHLTLKQTKPPEFQKPTTPIPQTAQDILRNILKNAVRKEVMLDAMRDMKQFQKLPSPSLVSRLHAMAGRSDWEKFMKALKTLRSTAAEKLKTCRNKQQNLMDFLNNKNELAKDVFQKSKLPNMHEMCEEIGYRPENDAAFAAELSRLYLTTFFSTMRKAKNEAQEAANE